MKSFIRSIHNRVKAGYLLWLTLHLILYIASGNFLTFDNRFMVWGEDTLGEIYPLGGGLAYYDYSDFFLYLLVPCLLYTSDAADERSSVDLGGRRIIKKKK